MKICYREKLYKKIDTRFKNEDYLRDGMPKIDTQALEKEITQLAIEELKNEYSGNPKILEKLERFLY